jgi:hypothetical protein
MPGHLVTLWADPDIGESIFYVVLEPAPSAAAALISEVDVWVEPVSQRLPRKVYRAVQEVARGHLRFAAKPELDVREMWAVGVEIRTADGAVHSFATQVEATPPGLGPWELLVNLIPFVLFGGLWAMVFVRRARNRASQGTQKPPTAAAKPGRCCHSHDHSPP